MVTSRGIEAPWGRGEQEDPALQRSRAAALPPERAEQLSAIGMRWA